MMALKRWNTLRIAAYVGIAGLIWTAFQTAGYWTLGPESEARAIGKMAGGFVGGAALGAIFSGLRNVWLRAH
jgi:hypothetical protein